MNEEKMKAMAAREANGASIGNCAGVARDTDAPSLRQRIKSQLRRAQDEARKENALHELEYLLDKNPEVARILDLLDQIGK